MARISVLTEDVELDAPMLVEGFPGVGLVGKIAADHLVDAFDMTHYANVHCEGIPPVATYSEGERSLRTPVRLYADAERGLTVLQSDVPIQPQAATKLAGCLADWFDEHDMTPLYLSGLPRQKDDEPPEVYGIGTGDGESLLSEADVDAPAETGMISGPTGALLAHAVERDRTSVALVVESDPRFPDPEAARALLSRGIQPLTGVEVDMDDLVDKAEEIRQAKEQLARRMQESDEESSKAQPLRMYQ